MLTCFYLATGLLETSDKRTISLVMSVSDEQFRTFKAMSVSGEFLRTLMVMSVLGVYFRTFKVMSE